MPTAKNWMCLVSSQEAQGCARLRCACKFVNDEPTAIFRLRPAVLFRETMLTICGGFIIAIIVVIVVVMVVLVAMDAY